jgi:hypothetical protein
MLLKLDLALMDYDKPFIATGGAVIKLPKNKSLVTLDWLNKKIADKMVDFKNYTGEFKDFIKKQGIKATVYATTYGIGVELLFVRQNGLDELKNRMTEIGLKYTTEVSDGGYVYRFKISKSADNLKKLKELS